MGAVLTGSLNTPGQTKKNATVRIQTVANGFLIHPEYQETMIANTLAEALEIARKVLE